MKKLTTILLFAYMHIFCAYSQIEEDHFYPGAFIGFVGNIEAYEILKDTQLKPWQSKAISFVVGTGLGILAGHAKEIYDEKQGRKYSRKDFNSTLLGAFSGSLAVRLALWNSIPESHVPIEEIWLLENEFVNNE